MSIRDSVVNLILRGRDLISPATRSAGQGMQDLERRSADLQAQLDRLSETERNAAAFERLKRNSADLLSEFQRLSDESGRLQQAIASTENPSRSMVREFERAQQATGRARLAHERNAQELARLEPRLRAAGVDTRRLSDEQSRLSEQSRRLRGNVTEVNAALEHKRKMADRAAVAAQASGEASARAGAGFSALASRVLAAAGAYVSLQKLKDGIVSVLRTGDQFESLGRQMTTAFGSAEKGAEAVEWVKRFATDTPLQMQEVTDAFLGLKNYGLDPTKGALQALVDQNEALGGGQERLKGIVSAVGQAWAKQKLQTEEILQLVERGVPVWDMLTTATGKSVAELQNLASKGELGRESIQLLLDEMAKANQGAAAGAMSSLSGLISNLQDRWSDWLNTVANSGALDYAKDQLRALSDRIEQLARDGTLQRWAQATSDAIVSAGEVIKGAVTSVAEYKDQILALGKAFIAFKTAQAVQGLAAWGAALRAQRAEMIASQAAMGGFAGAGRGLLGVLASLGRPVQITLAVVGYEIASAAADALMRKLHGVEEAQLRLKQQEAELRGERIKDILAIDEKRRALEGYAKVSTLTQAQVRAMSEAERQAYAGQLASAREYYRYAIESLEKQVALGRSVGPQLEQARQQYAAITDSLQAISVEADRVGTALKLGISGGALDAANQFVMLKAKGTETAEAIEQTFKGLDLSSPEGVRSLSESLGLLVRTAQVSGDQVKEALAGSLKDVGSTELAALRAELQRAFGEGRLSAEGMSAAMDAIANRSLVAVGLSLEQLRTGLSETERSAIQMFDVFTASGQRSADEVARFIEAIKGQIKSPEALNALQGVVTNWEKTSTGAVDRVRTSMADLSKDVAGAADQVFAALQQRIKSAGTAEALAEITKEILDLSTQGKIAAEIVGPALVEVRRRGEELKASNPAETMERVAEASAVAQGELEGAGDAMSDFAERSAAAAAELEVFKQRGRDIAEGLASTINNTTQSMWALGDNVGRAFEQLQFGTSGARTEVERLRAELERARGEASDFGSAALHSGFTFGGYLNDLAAAAANVRARFYQQRLEVVELAKAFEEGRIPVGALSYDMEDLQRRFDLLDDSDLSGLLSQINRVQSQIDSLNGSLTNTITALRQELASLQGDTIAVEDLRYQEQKLELEERYQQAKKTGDQESIRLAEEALRLQQQAYELRRKSAQEAEAEARARAAEQRQREAEAAQERERREREQQDQQAARDRIDDTRAQSTKTTTQTTQTHRIELVTSTGRQTRLDVPADQVAGFLDVLSEAGLRTR